MTTTASYRGPTTSNLGGTGIHLEYGNLMQRLDAEYLLGPPLKRYWWDARDTFQHWAEYFAPKRTGKLSRSHKGRIDPSAIPLWMTMTNTVWYAKIVRYGTRPHIILPRRKKALWWPTARHPVAMVHHPGTKPNRWMDKARERTERDMLGSLGNKFRKEVANRFNG